jgi:glycosyltransferase involved in cell wall biosynthesis
MPLVTIILNVRNGAVTLREAMDSVLAQTCNDWELIVWDDRSTDASAVIISEYRDSRIHYYLSPDHISLGKSRRDAMDLARGEWIAFIDQDDIWLPGKLEKQLALSDNDVGLIYGRTVRFYLNGRERDYDQAHEYQFLPEGDIFAQLFTASCFIAMSSAIFRRSAVEAIGGIAKEIRIIPDYFLYLAIAQRYRVRAVQEVICRYRELPGSMSHLAAREMHQEALWLVNQWAGQLDPDVIARCRRRHFTAIALEEMHMHGMLCKGFVHLLTQGSVVSQFVRPFAFAFHLARRNVRQPYWRRLTETSA